MIPPHRSKIKGEGRGFLHDHLLAGKQRVADELASPQSNGSVGHFGVCWMEEVSTGSLRMSNFQFSCGVGSARVDTNPIGGSCLLAMTNHSLRQSG
jgi:hypothetical protein